MSNTNEIPKPPKVVVAPRGCGRFLTPGKEYTVTEIWDSFDPDMGYGFMIISDRGHQFPCSELNCDYARGNWIIKEREE